MKLLGKLEIKSAKKIKQFLDEEHVGRIASVDKDGFPQIIPMNFVFYDGAIYMHSHTKGEKLDNIQNDSRVGFEVDRELEFLPSYFEDPRDASMADTLYISVVIKGTGSIVDDLKEKAAALNEMMKKYQPEGRYEPVRYDMAVMDHVAVIKIIPKDIRGKYKIGQHMHKDAKIRLAENIRKRNSKSAKETLKIMGFSITGDSLTMNDEPEW